MATFFYFKFRSDDLLISDPETGKVNLSKIYEFMTDNLATLSREGSINSEGFINPGKLEIGNNSMLHSYCSVQGSLGYFNEAELADNHVTSRRVHHTYYSQAELIITDNYKVILIFNYSEELAGKTRAKALIEQLGLELESVKFTHSVLTKLKENYVWDRAKLDKIDRFGDSTKTISFEIDPAGEKNSEVNTLYENHGELISLSFNFPIEDDSAKTIKMKLYKDGHGNLNNSEVEESTRELNYILFKLMGIIN